MTGYWKKDRAGERIDRFLATVQNPEIGVYGPGKVLTDIPTSKAYRLDGVHVYVDLVNFADILNGQSDSDLKRALRFLSLHYRAIHRVLNDVGAIKVDFAGPRLHAVIVEPQESEAGRINRAIATAQMILEVLKATGKDSQGVPAAKVRVGIDSGAALVVNNGRNKNREPLFLGHPANYAAKLAAGRTGQGIFLANGARSVLKEPRLSDDKSAPLTGPQVTTAQQAANLGIGVDTVVSQWRADLAARPLASFEFHRHTPPFSSLKIARDVTPARTVRQEAVSLFADIDGFTKYVARHITDRPADVVKALHVIRSELDAVLHADFGGRKVRFIGDCLHGILVEGTVHKTDAEATVSVATLAAGAMRSSFNLCLEKLKAVGVDVAGLDLAIGFEYGKLAVTRLGMKGDMIRCVTSLAVLESEDEQQRCDAKQTAIGPLAFKEASRPVADLFGTDRKRGGLTYEKVEAELDGRDDATAAKARDSSRKAVGSESYGAVGGASLRAFGLLRAP